MALVGLCGICVLLGVSCSNPGKAAYKARFAVAGDGVREALAGLEEIVAHPKTDVDAYALALESFGELARRQDLRRLDPPAYTRATGRLLEAIDEPPRPGSSEPDREKQLAGPLEVGYLQGIATVALGSLKDPMHDALLVDAATSTRFLEPAASFQRAALGQVVLRLKSLQGRRSLRGPLMRGLRPMLAAATRDGAVNASAAADLKRYVVHLENELADLSAVTELLEDEARGLGSDPRHADDASPVVAAIRLHHRVLAGRLRRGGFDGGNAPTLEALRTLALGPDETIALEARASAAGLAPLALAEWMVAGLQATPSEPASNRASARLAMSDHLMAAWDRVLHLELLRSSGSTGAGVVGTARNAPLDLSGARRDPAARAALAERVADAVRRSTAGLDPGGEPLSARLGFLARVFPKEHVRWVRDEAATPTVRDQDAHAAREVANQAVSILAREGVLSDEERLETQRALAGLGAHRDRELREDVLATVASETPAAVHRAAEATLLEAIDRRPKERAPLTDSYVRFLALVRGDAPLAAIDRERLLTLALNGSGESAAAAYGMLWRDGPDETYEELVQRLTATAEVPRPDPASRPEARQVTWVSEGLLRGGHTADEDTRNAARSWLAHRFPAADEDTRLLILRGLLESGGVGDGLSDEAFAAALAESPLLQQLLDAWPEENP